MSMSKTDTALNREGWLHKLVEDYVAPHVKAATGLSVPMSKIQISVGFPASRARPNKNGVYTTGQCFHGEDQGGIHHIFIHPGRDFAINNDGHGIAETVIHEYLHAALPAKTKHNKAFAKAANASGLEGKPTSTNATPALVETIRGWIKELGPYPHKAVDAGGFKKQTTRLLKVCCPDCGYVNEQGNGYTIRVTQSWINVGLPTCPCGEEMIAVEADDPIMRLKPVESHAVFQVPMDGDEKKMDPRFEIRRSTGPTGEHWTVIDYGQMTYKRTMTVGGEQVEVDVPILEGSQTRMVAAEGREEAISMIHAVREGLFSWDDLEDDQGTEDDDLDLDARIEALVYVEDDEDEGEDFDDLAPEDEEEYERQTALRESSGARKSEQIGRGAEGALD
jgi:hypothetical protein